MIISCLMKQSLRIFCLTILSTLMLNIDANALDVTAPSCSNTNIQSAVYQVKASGGGGGAWVY